MRTCPVCAQRLGSFFPLPVAYVEKQNAINPECSLDDFETLNVGQYQCPRCQASDRDRLYALYAQHLLRWPSDHPLRLLEIAPAPALSRCLQALARVEYRSADLVSDLAMDKVDITDMRGNYADSRFDFVICSHVLEHVRDDRAAMRELFRVLAPGGCAVLMVPMLLSQRQTDEDPDEADVAQRLRRFGQEDHVRRYAKADYLARLAEAGFEVEALDQARFEQLAGEPGLFRAHGIAAGSVLYIGHKRGAPVLAAPPVAALPGWDASAPDAGAACEVTIAIPAYKPHYFEAALRSALAQRAIDFEVLVCDDSGGELIEAIVERCRADTRQPLRYERNLCPLTERGNVARCLQLARGRFIKLLYDDDLLAPDCVARLASVLRERPEVALVSSRRDIVDVSGQPVSGGLAHRFPFDADVCVHGRDVASFLADQTLNFIGEPSTVMFRREQALTVSGEGVYTLAGEDIRWVGDLALYVKLLQHGHLVMLAESLSSFRVSPQQVSQMARDTPSIGDDAHLAFQRQLLTLGWYHGNQRVRVRRLAGEDPFEAFDLVAFWRSCLAPGAGDGAGDGAVSGTGAAPAAYDPWVRQRRRNDPPVAGVHVLHLSVLVHALDRDTSVVEDTLASLGAQWRPAERQRVLDLTQAAPAELGLLDDGWTLLLAAGDVLEPDALHQIEQRLLQDDATQACLLYCDHDEVGPDGRLCKPTFKPAPNPDLLYSSPYPGRTLVVRNTWAATHESGRSQGVWPWTYGLCLAALREGGAQAWVHLAQALVHQSPAVLPTWVLDSGTWQTMARLLSAHLAIAEPACQVIEGPAPGTFHVLPPLPRAPLVSIVIPTRDQVGFLSRCIESLLAKTDYPAFEILVVDNNSCEENALAFLAGLEGLSSDQIRVLRVPGAFNFSRMNNLAVAQARGELILMLNNDTAALQADWLQHMVRQVLRPGVGVVGARLLYPDGKLQHAGVILGLRGPADHPCIGLDADAPGYLFRAQLTQNFSAVTAACLLVSKNLYTALGGLDETTFGVSYNDVDFCLRVGQTGARIVWTPLATLLHEGSASQRASVENLSMEKKTQRYSREQSAMFQRWPQLIADDPAYNPNLSLVERGYEVETNPLLCQKPMATAEGHRVVAFAADPFGCGHYRVIQPMQAMLAHKLCSGGTSPELFGPHLALRSGADTLVFQRPTRDSDQVLLESLLALPHVRKIFEVDDDLSRIPIKSAHHTHMPKDMRARTLRSIGLCDRLVVSTEPLAHTLRGASGDVRVVPNRLPPAMWGQVAPRRVQRHAGHKPVVGWAGGVGHAGDLELIAQVVRDTADQIDWVFFGMCPDSIRPYVKAFYAGVPTLSYPSRLMELMRGWDLAVAPLEVNAFNECKSNLRLLEYGWSGVPVVCSDVLAYQGDLPVTRVKNRYKDWRNVLQGLLAEPERLHQQGLALQASVAQDWVLDARHAQAWHAAWTQF